MIVTDSNDKGKDSSVGFCPRFNFNIKLEEGQELVIYTDGPSSEFRIKYITGKFLHMISCQIQRPVHWKYFATSHGKGVVDGIGGAAQARVREKVKSKG